jgi:hypothetical protein
VQSSRTIMPDHPRFKIALLLPSQLSPSDPFLYEFIFSRSRMCDRPAKHTLGATASLRTQTSFSYTWSFSPLMPLMGAGA